MNWLRHVIFLGIAVALTYIGFHFWSNFGAAMEHFNEQRVEAGRASDAAAAARAQQTPATPGEVTVGIIPAPRTIDKPACDKKHPCPH